MSGPGQRQYVSLGDPAVVGQLLERACREVADIEHAVMTSRDGLVVAANQASGGSHGVDTIAMRSSAMAAAAAGVGDHFTALLAQGRLQSATFEATRGCIGVYPLTSALLLVVTGTPSVTVGRFNAAAKKVLHILQAPSV